MSVTAFSCVSIPFIIILIYLAYCFIIVLIYSAAKLPVCTGSFAAASTDYWFTINLLTYLLTYLSSTVSSAQCAGPMFCWDNTK